MASAYRTRGKSWCHCARRMAWHWINIFTENKQQMRLTCITKLRRSDDAYTRSAALLSSKWNIIRDWHTQKKHFTHSALIFFFSLTRSLSLSFHLMCWHPFRSFSIIFFSRASMQSSWKLFSQNWKCHCHTLIPFYIYKCGITHLFDVALTVHGFAVFLPTSVPRSLIFSQSSLPPIDYSMLFFSWKPKVESTNILLFILLPFCFTLHECNRRIFGRSTAVFFPQPAIENKSENLNSSA